MPNVLVIGATGYVGSALSEQLIRSGDHYVYAVSRSDEEGFRLATKEIIPIRGSLDSPQEVFELISSNNIDIIVDTTSYNDKTTKSRLLNVIAGAENLRQQQLAKKQLIQPKLGFVTVSGIWTQGSTEDPYGSFQQMAPEATSVQPEEGLVESKALYEQEVLAARVSLDVAILQPSFIWARGGAAWTRILGPLVEGARTGTTDTLKIAVDPADQIYCFTQIDDVAAAIELAVNKLQLINGNSVHPVFELVGDQFPIGLLCERDAKYFGCKGKAELVKPEGTGFLDVIGGNRDANRTRAEQILGWYPKKRYFLRDTFIYANSFMAALALAKHQ
ncbi:NAD(P)-binding protein [Trichoderma sp. SZMC 28014]